MRTACAVAAVSVLAGSALGAVRSGELVLIEGAPVPGAGASANTVSTPYTDPAGKVGFTVRLETGEWLVFYDGAIRFRASQAPAPFTLASFEDTSGYGTGGSFIISPSIAVAPSTNSDDGIWTSAGVGVIGRQAAPGLAGRFLRSLARPTMFGDSSFGFVASTAVAPTGTISGRAVYRGTLASPASPTLVFATSTPLPGGFAFSQTSSGISFDYDFADNGLHHIHRVIVNQPPATTDIQAVLVNGAFALREGEAVPGSDFETWGTFTGGSINNAGNWIVGGVMVAASNRDAFLAYNGTVKMREDDTVDGVFVSFPATVQGMSLNNLGQAVFVWRYFGNPDDKETLFATCDISAAAPVFKALATTGDTLDTNGDLVGDLSIVDFQTSPVATPGLDLAEDGKISVLVTLANLDGTNPREGVVRFSTTCPAAPPACVADVTGAEPGVPDGGVTIEDLLFYLEVFGQGGLAADVDDGTGTGTRDGGVTIEDLLYYLFRFSEGC